MDSRVLCDYKEENQTGWPPQRRFTGGNQGWRGAAKPILRYRDQAERASVVKNGCRAWTSMAWLNSSAPR